MPSRREMLTSGAAVVTAAALAGCQALFGGDEEKSGSANPGDGEIPEEPLRLGALTFYSGPGSTYSEDGANVADMIVDQINKEGGILGKRDVELVKIDEAAGTDENIKRVRELASGDKIDALIGCTSSATALAMAPVAENNELPFVIDTSATTELWDQWFYDDSKNDAQYTFRTSGASAHTIGGAVYVANQRPDVKTIATINPDYEMGQNANAVFTDLIEQTRPDIDIVEERLPPFFADDFTSHITAIKDANPDLLFCSQWGGDLLNLVNQGHAANLFEGLEMLLIWGDTAFEELKRDYPEGSLVCVRGNGHFDYMVDRRPAQTAFVEEYLNRYDQPPASPAYDMWKSYYFYFTGIEKAYKIAGSYPSDEQIASAMENLAIQVPTGPQQITNHEVQTPLFIGRTTFEEGTDYPILTDPVVIEESQIAMPSELATQEWLETFN